MFYPNLMNIAENLENEKYIISLLKKLDEWLATLSFQRLERINPYQFSFDYNLNEIDVLRIFFEGYKLQLFNVKYEVRSDENEYITDISRDQYKALISKQESLFLYSRWSGEEEEFFDYNVQLWFSVEMTPDSIPETVEYLKKEKTSPLRGDNSLIAEMLMGR